MTGEAPLDFERLRHHPLLAAAESHESLPSTSDRALQLANRAGTACPALIVAQQQTQGRGRGTNRWWSQPGSLTFTLLLETASLQVPSDRLPLISLAAALSVCDAVRPLLGPTAVHVKWPNDVYAARRKLCGILLESSRGMRHIAVGIGLNVNNSLAQAPADVRVRATSIRDLVHQSHSRTDLLWQLLSQIQLHLSLLAGDSLYICRRWPELCLLTGETVEVACGDQIVAGTCRGINEQGALLIEHPLGLQACVAGVVKWPVS